MEHVYRGGRVCVTLGQRSRLCAWAKQVLRSCTNQVRRGSVDNSWFILRKSADSSGKGSVWFLIQGIATGCCFPALLLLHRPKISIALILLDSISVSPHTCAWWRYRYILLLYQSIHPLRRNSCILKKCPSYAGYLRIDRGL